MKLLIPFLAIASAAAETATYDPLKVPTGEIVSKTLDVKDAARDRTLPVRVYLPEKGKPAPVILFSHGLGGSRDNSPYLGEHWANLILRAKDIPATIDALTAWNSVKDHPLHGRLDLKHIGMSGHSFGAVTTQAVAGQSMGGGRVSFSEPRVTAAVMFSPSPPKLGDPAAAFGTIKIPCLLMTGTLDTSPIGNTGAEDRLRVYPFLTNVPAWQVVFDKATHMSFGDRDLMGKSEKENRYHAPILALTTAFWDAELKKDPAAKSWLNGPGAKAALTSQDKWEMNSRAKDRL
jgi:dienelactone hydrolase